MANSNGHAADSLIEKLAQEPFGCDFYALVRLLQSRFGEQPRIGHSLSPAQDPVRFAQSLAMDFAPATVESIQRKDSSRPAVICFRHFGLFGPNGPMPLCLTEYARDRILHHGDATFAAFCNVFHHRLLSFFFRAWADAQKTVDFDRPANQCWFQFVSSLIGLGMGSLERRDHVPDRAKLFFAGRLVQQNRNAEGLEAIIQDFFGIHAEIRAFVGQWLMLPPGSTCKLGESRENGAVGTTVIVGSRIWTCQLHFRIRVGPMKLAEMERLLPTGGSFSRLCDWVRQYTGDEFTWDVQFVLVKEEVPSVQLGQAGRLGWTTWLKTKPFQKDAEDLVLQGH